MIVLGIETSCDDTAAAVLDGRRLLASVVTSQDEIHGPYGGVVPELASRQHIRNILPVVHAALVRAGLEITAIEGVAATCGPGLIGSLLVGLCLAKALAWRRRIPFVGVNHLEGHILAVGLEREVRFPFLALVVSGGHTGLYLVRAPGAYELCGRTRDDAVGEAFDKAAKMLGLGYPGGPAIERLARYGNPRAVRFPRAHIRTGGFDFSFSGVKTAIWLYLQRHRPTSGDLPDLAASIEAALVDMVIEPTLAAAEAARAARLVVAGGVSANARLRARLAEACLERGIEVFFPRPALCTDNAAMIALAGMRRLEDGERDPWDLNADASLALGCAWDGVPLAVDGCS